MNLNELEHMGLCTTNTTNVRVYVDATNKYKEDNEMDNIVTMENVKIRKDLMMCRGYTSVSFYERLHRGYTSVSFYERLHGGYTSVSFYERLYGGYTSVSFYERLYGGYTSVSFYERLYGGYTIVSFVYIFHTL